MNTEEAINKILNMKINILDLKIYSHGVIEHYSYIQRRFLNLCELLKEEFEKKLIRLIAEEEERIFEEAPENLKDYVTMTIIKNPCWLICGHKFNIETVLNIIKDDRSNKMFYKCPLCRSEGSEYFEDEKNFYGHFLIKLQEEHNMRTNIIIFECFEEFDYILFLHREALFKLNREKQKIITEETYMRNQYELEFFSLRDMHKQTFINGKRNITIWENRVNFSRGF